MVIALLKLAVDLDILDIEHRTMGKALLGAPVFTVLYTMFVRFSGSMLDLDLLLQVVHCITKLQVVCHVRHLFNFKFLKRF